MRILFSINWCCTVALGNPSSAFAVHYEGEPSGALRGLVASILALGPEVRDR